MAKKISKSDTTPEMEQRSKESAARLKQMKSQHFEPGTFVVYKNRRYLLLCYRPSDGKMVLDRDDGQETLALVTYSMLNS